MREERIDVSGGVWVLKLSMLWLHISFSELLYRESVKSRNFLWSLDRTMVYSQCNIVKSVVEALYLKVSCNHFYVNCHLFFSIDLTLYVFFSQCSRWTPETTIGPYMHIKSQLFGVVVIKSSQSIEHEGFKFHLTPVIQRALSTHQQ